MLMQLQWPESSQRSGRASGMSGMAASRPPPKEPPPVETVMTVLLLPLPTVMTLDEPLLSPWPSDGVGEAQAAKGVAPSASQGHNVSAKRSDERRGVTSRSSSTTAVKFRSANAGQIPLSDSSHGRMAGGFLSRH
jgi:hypothetical protein